MDSQFLIYIRENFKSKGTGQNLPGNLGWVLSEKRLRPPPIYTGDYSNLGTAIYLSSLKEKSTLRILGPNNVFEIGAKDHAVENFDR